MSALAEILFGGLFQGSLYAIMAVGLALVWTTIGVFNFSHGVFMMLGAYIAWQLVELGLPAAVAFPIAVVVMAGVGWILQASVVRPLIGRPNIVLVVVITTLAAGSLIENGALTVWGPDRKSVV